VVDVIEDTKMG